VQKIGLLAGKYGNSIGTGFECRQ